MQTNTLFSFQRFLLLGKQTFIINKKMIGISLAGFAGLMFFVLFTVQSAANFQNWDNHDAMVTFFFLFLQFGFIYNCLSFPSFRTKEKSMAYLMLPATVSEKFTFELLTRIVLYILLMPLLFWMVANLEGVIIHYFIPDLQNYKFSFIAFVSDMIRENKMTGWVTFAILQGILFVFIASFTGASHFSKSPLLKTGFAFTLIIAGYGLYSFLLVKGLNLEAFHPANNRVLFIKNEVDGIAALSVGAAIINLCLITMAYYKLKEREA